MVDVALNEFEKQRGSWEPWGQRIVYCRNRVKMLLNANNQDDLFKTLWETEDNGITVVWLGRNVSRLQEMRKEIKRITVDIWDSLQSNNLQEPEVAKLRSLQYDFEKCLSTIPVDSGALFRRAVCALDPHARFSPCNGSAYYVACRFPQQNADLLTNFPYQEIDWLTAELVFSKWFDSTFERQLLNAISGSPLTNDYAVARMVFSCYLVLQTRRHLSNTGVASVGPCVFGSCTRPRLRIHVPVVPLLKDFCEETLCQIQSVIARAVPFLEDLTGLRYYPVPTLIVPEYVIKEVRRALDVEEAEPTNVHLRRTWGVYLPRNSASPQLSVILRNYNLPERLGLHGCGRVLLCEKEISDYLEKLPYPGINAEDFRLSIAIHEHAHAIIAEGLDGSGRPSCHEYDAGLWKKGKRLNESLAEWTELHYFRNDPFMYSLIVEHAKTGEYPHWPYRGALNVEEKVFMPGGIQAVRELINDWRQDPAEAESRFEGL